MASATSEQATSANGDGEVHENPLHRPGEAIDEEFDARYPEVSERDEELQAAIPNGGGAE
jgi:hypothetical protein